MRLPHLVLVTALVALPLAGCLGDESPSPAAPAARNEPLANGATLAEGAAAVATLAEKLASDPANASADAPVWSVGDAWDYTGLRGGEPTGSGTLVVAQASAATYTLLATGADLATADAVFDISYVGPVRVADLAGAQEGTAVKFFDFPLRDGKSWTATWDGNAVTIVAKANPSIATPAGTHAGYDITASLEDGTVHATYDYVPALKWWSRIAFSEGWELRIDAAKSNWTGEALRGVANPLFDLAPVGPLTNTPAEAFTVAPEQDALVLILSGFTNIQARAIVLQDPSGAPVFLPGGDDVYVAPQPSGEFRSETLPATPGSWHVAMLGAHDPDGFVSLRGFEVALERIAV